MARIGGGGGATKRKRRVYTPTAAAYPTPKKTAPKRPVYTPTRAAYPTPKPRAPVAGPPTPSKGKLAQIRKRNERAKAQRDARATERTYTSLAKAVKKRAREQPIERRALAQERYYSSFKPPKPARPKKYAHVRSGIQIPDVEGKTIGETKGGQLAKRYTVAPALKGLEELQRTSYAAGGAARAFEKEDTTIGSVLTGAKKGLLKQGKVETPGEVILEDWKPKSGLGKFAKGAATVAIDIPTDVTSYAGGALIGVGRKAALKASEQAGEAAARAQYKTLRAAGTSRSQARKQAKAHGETVRRRSYEREAKRRDVANERRGVSVTFAGRRTRAVRRKLARKLLPKPRRATHFHGTPTEFTGGVKGEHPLGAFVTTDRQYAKGYAGKGGKVLDVKVKKRKARKTLDMRSGDRRVADVLDTLADSAVGARAASLRMEADAIRRGRPPEGKRGWSDLLTKMRAEGDERLRGAVESHGFDSMRFHDDGRDTLALFKPGAARVRRKGLQGEPVAPLTRATVALGKSRKGISDIGRLPGTRITGRDISKVARKVTSSVHGGIRPVRAGKEGDVAISHETNIAEKALRREGRAETERLIREAQSRYNALWKRLDDGEAVQVRDAIESGRLTKLRGNKRLLDAAVELRDEGRYLQRIESRAGPLAGRVGQKSRSREEVALSGRATQPERARHLREVTGQREAAEREVELTQAEGRALPVKADEATKQVAKAYGKVVDRKSGARLGNVRTSIGHDKTVGIVADIKIGDEVVGTYSRVLDPQSGTVTKARTSIDDGELRGRGIGTRLGRAEERRLADVGVRRVETEPVTEGGEKLTRRLGGFRAEQRAGVEPSLQFAPGGRGRAGRGSIDTQGRLHTWPEDLGTHEQKGFGQGAKSADFVINPDGTIHVHVLAGKTEEEVLARAMVQDPRLKPPRHIDPDALQEQLKRVRAETHTGRYSKRLGSQYATRRRIEAVGEVEEATRAERAVQRRVGRVEDKQAELKRLKRERLRGQAKAYFPRATDEELDELVQGGLVQRLAADIKPSREKVGRAKPQAGPQKQRKHRETVAALREGTPEQRAHAERLSENIREVQALRGMTGARVTGQAILNRKIADEFGAKLPQYQSVTRDSLKDLKGQGKSVYYLHRGNLEQLDPLDDFPEIKRASMDPATRARSDQARMESMKQAGWSEDQIREEWTKRAKGGRYVVLEDAQVARVQGDEAGLGSKAGLEAWDAANRGFKGLALMTPQYLTRNFTGDMFNAWTEENVFRMMRNVVAGQRPLHALGQRERAQRIGNVDKRRKKLDQIEHAFTAFNRKIGRDPKLRTIKLSPEVAREIAGPSAQRLYQVIRRGNPNLTKQQIQDQIEDNLREGKVSAVAFAQLAERYGVVRQGRFQELMTEGRSPLKGKAGGTPWALITKRVEDSNRIGTFMSGLQRGMTPREAADRAIQVHFDYGDLTPIEKGVLRRMAPFYTFPSRNVPLQARQLVRRPGKYSTIEKIRQQAASAAGLQDGWEENLSDFEMRQIPLPFRFGTKPDGTPNVITASIGSPFTDLNDIIGFGTGAANVTRSITDPEAAKAAQMLNVPLIPVKRAMEMLGPIKVFAEAPLNKSFYFREDIAPEGRELTRAPEWAIALSKLPAGYGTMWKKFARIKQKGDGPVMWDKRSEHMARAFQPGIVGMGAELASQMGLPTAVEGASARGRTPKQRLAGYLTGVRAVPYDPKQARINRNYDRRFRLEATNSQERQLTKEQTGRDWEESDQSPAYKRRLETIREINATIEGLQGKRKKKASAWGAGPASAFSGGGSDGSVWK